MEELLSSLILSVESKNWHAALLAALTLPDICGSFDKQESENIKESYIKWFDMYLLKKYTAYVGANHEEHIFLNGDDCYALRCCYLHQGSGDISKARARKALNNFIFVEPNNMISMHRNYFARSLEDGTLIQTLQLRVDIFG